MNFIFPSPARDKEILINETWALYSTGEDAVIGTKALEMLQANNLTLKRVQQKARNPKARKAAEDILFRRLRNTIQVKTGIDLIKAKDLIEKSSANP